MVLLENNELNKLRKVLEVSHGSIRLVTYFGVAEALIDRHIANVTNTNQLTPAKLSLTFDRIVDEIGEISIIDRDIFKSCLRKVYNFRINLSNPTNYTSRLDRIYSYNSLLEVLGVTEVYSNDDIFEINKHFDIYRNAVLVTMDAMKKEQI